MTILHLKITTIDLTHIVVIAQKTQIPLGATLND